MVVLDPVDSASAASMVNLAKQQNVPVISYDRLILDSAGVDYYVSFDNEKVGELQGKALSDKLAADGNPTGPIVQINGSPTDNNAKLFGQGAVSAVRGRPTSRSRRSTTPRTGARTRPSARWSRPSPRSARTGSRASTR